MLAPNNCQPRAAHGRLFGRLFSLLGTLAAVLVFTSPSGASTPAIEVYQSWSLRCANGILTVNAGLTASSPINDQILQASPEDSSGIAAGNCCPGGDPTAVDLFAALDNGTGASGLDTGDVAAAGTADGGGPNNQLPPCEIIQVVRPRYSDAPVLQLAFAYNAKRGVYGVHLVLPKDIRMSGGLVVRLDGAVDLDYRVVWCDATACISEKLIGEGEIALFKGAGKGFVAVVDGDGSLQTIPLSFLGFNEALTAMIDLNRKWAEERPRHKN